MLKSGGEAVKNPLCFVGSVRSIGRNGPGDVWALARELDTVSESSVEACLADRCCGGFGMRVEGRCSV